MKLLMIYCKKFSYSPANKSLEDAEEITEGASFENVQVAFIQAEETDESSGRIKSIEKKLLNYIKWAARKNETKNVILHSFAHLSYSKASPQFTKDLFDRIEVKLKNTSHVTAQTPFGYFLDLQVDAPGESLARIFHSFD